MSSVSKVPGFKRCSFSLPVGVAADIEFVSSAMGLSQSAFVAQVLGETVSGIRELLAISCVGDSDLDSPDVVRRLRGGSVQFVQDKVSEFMGQLDSISDSGGTKS